MSHVPHLYDVVNQGISNHGQHILTKFCARCDMSTGDMQHSWDNLILHLAPTKSGLSNMGAMQVDACLPIRSDFLFDIVTLLQANTSLVHKIIRSLAVMAVVFKISFSTYKSVAVSVLL